MFKPSGKAAILSIMTIGAALSLGMAAARAGDNVTEDQILRALTPEKKPP
ncbi:OmpA family protein, partial [Bradyrhizobium sp. Arg68]|nr:OmpA family protein [Bradyrhizobium ivorense]